MRKNLRTRQTYQLRRRLKDGNSDEGTPIIRWDAAVPIEATIWAASGRIQVEMYGEHLAYMKNMEYEGDEVISEKDGICVFVSADEEPDYEVRSVNTDYRPWVYTLERRVSYGGTNQNRG